MTTATKVVIKPLEDRIVVRPLEAEQTTASGLADPGHRQGEAPGGRSPCGWSGRFDDAGTKRVPIDVKVGDVVLYSKYGGTEVKYAGEEYLVLSCSRRTRRHRQVVRVRALRRLGPPERVGTLTENSIQP